LLHVHESDLLSDRTRRHHGPAKPGKLPRHCIPVLRELQGVPGCHIHRLDRNRAPRNLLVEVETGDIDRGNATSTRTSGAGAERGGEGKGAGARKNSFHSGTSLLSRGFHVAAGTILTRFCCIFKEARKNLDDDEG
jgi:hypothetical protein